MPDRSPRPSGSPTHTIWHAPDLGGLELYAARSSYHIYPRHAHATYSIGVIEQGVGGTYYRGASHEIPPHGMLVMNPDEVHTGYTVGETGLTYHMLYPSIELLQQVMPELSHWGTPQFREAVIYDAAFATQIYHLHHLLGASTDRLQREAWLIEVLTLVVQRYTDINITPTAIGQEQQTIALMKDYLWHHYQQNISLEDLSRLTGLNTSYLVRLFRQAIGMPPYAYLTQIRLEKAKLLLQQGEPIAAVALAVGLSDQSHLTRHFKRLFGTTPGHYRAQVKIVQDRLIADRR